MAFPQYSVPLFCCFVFSSLHNIYANTASFITPYKQSGEVAIETHLNKLADEKSIELAKKYIKDNKGKDALQVLSPLLISLPNYDIYLLTAQSYAEINNPSVSIDFYQKARELADTNEKRQIASQGIVKMQYWLSQSTPGTYRVLSPKESMDLARKHIDANEGIEALEVLNPLLLNKPDYDAYLLMAQSYAEINKPLQSLELYKKARALAQHDMQRQIADTGILKMQTWLNQAHEKLVSDSNKVIEQARKYINENKGKNALELLKPLLVNSPDYEILLLTAQSYAELDNPLDALDYYEKALKKANNPVQQKIATSGIQKMQAWLIESKSSNKATDLNTAMDLARKYIEENKGKEALEVLRSYTKLVNFDVFILLAQSYAELDNPASSLEFYKKAHQIAKTKGEKQVAATGIIKMTKWLGSFDQPKPKSPLEKALDLARKYLGEDKGKQALEILNRLLIHHPNYTVFILTAQSYAITDKPLLALAYYKLALQIAKTKPEQIVAFFGIAKMQFWLSEYYQAQHTFEHIMQQTDKKQDYELALAGRVKSLAYENRPITGFRAIPPNLKFTTPQMVVAAAQASLWSDWADITKNIVIYNKPILDTIPAKSPLSKDLQDVIWQMNQATWPNIISPSFYYFVDSDKFIIKRETLDYSHYWSQLAQSSIGVKAAQYRFDGGKVDAKSVYISQTLRPTRDLTLFGQVEPSDYSLWNPTLWIFRGNYRPSDYVVANINLAKEVVETVPAMFSRIMDNQYSGSVVLNPFPYVQFNGAVNQLNFSDTNRRQGYYLSASALVSPAYGINLTVQKRGFNDRFVSRLYFSPNHYVADTIIVRYSSKAGSVWHYYIDGGIGTQLIQVNGVDTSPAPTHQFGFGVNGPITNWLIFSGYYIFSTQATSFTDGTQYHYQAGAVSVKILL